MYLSPLVLVVLYWILCISSKDEYQIDPFLVDIPPD